jgi:hypothetical protein
LNSGDGDAPVTWHPNEILTVVNTVDHQNQALAVALVFGYMQAYSVNPTLELFTRVSASAAADGRETLTKAIDEWVFEASTLQRERQSETRPGRLPGFLSVPRSRP